MAESINHLINEVINQLGYLFCNLNDFLFLNEEFKELRRTWSWQKMSITPLYRKTDEKLRERITCLLYRLENGHPRRIFVLGQSLELEGGRVKHTVEKPKGQALDGAGRI